MARPLFVQGLALCALAFQACHAFQVLLPEAIFIPKFIPENAYSSALVPGKVKS